MTKYLVLLALVNLISCSNPSLSDLASSVKGTDVLKPGDNDGGTDDGNNDNEPSDPDDGGSRPNDPNDPSDPSDPNDPIPLPPPTNDPLPSPDPGGSDTVLKIKAHENKPSWKERPYKVIPRITYERSRLAAWCLFRQKGECVKNRQLFFKIETEQIKELISQKHIKSIHLKLDFSTFIYHFNTEIICLMNNKRCSGQAVGMNFKEPLKSITKFKYWNKDFLDLNESNIKTSNFMWKINNTWDEGAKKSHEKDSFMNLLTYFQMSVSDWEDIINNDEYIEFMIGDDTYIENAELVIVFKEQDS